jgi:tRNA(fMet)-specific endonuclease VapC
MANYLLDTNHASPLVTPGHPLREQILLDLNSGSNFSVCVPVVTETLFGISLLSRAEQNLAEWERLRLSLPCYIPDEEDAEAAAQLQIALRRRGWQLATVDALIAVVALRYNLTLLTTDKDFQTVPNLQQENWLPARRG